MRLEQVSRFRGRKLVLHDVDLEVRPGDVIGVVGSNGSGKTTLLRILVGLTRPSSGSVSRNAGTTAYVPEVFARPDRMSARQYLWHLGRIRGLSGSAARTRAEELLHRLSVTGGADLPLSRLSKGNVQKVVIAQALLVVPDLLVLDEPWSGLDAAVHGQLDDLVCEVAAAGGAVVLTDHDHEVVKSLSTRGFELAAGRLVESATRPTAVDLMTIELLAPANQGDVPVPWTGVPDVHRQWRSGRVHTVQVPRGAHDRLLVVAVTLGWSISAVAGPAAQPTRPRSWEQP